MPKAKLTRKQRLRRKRLQHIIVYVLLGTAIVAVRIFYPAVVDTAFDEVHTLSQDLKMLAKDGTSTVLVIVGLAYALRELWKAFRR